MISSIPSIPYREQLHTVNDLRALPTVSVQGVSFIISFSMTAAWTYVRFLRGRVALLRDTIKEQHT